MKIRMPVAIATGLLCGWVIWGWRESRTVSSTQVTPSQPTGVITQLKESRAWAAFPVLFDPLRPTPTPTLPPGPPASLWRIPPPQQFQPDAFAHPRQTKRIGKFDAELFSMGVRCLPPGLSLNQLGGFDLGLNLIDFRYVPPELKLK